jgi:hypothetical protein
MLNILKSKLNTKQVKILEKKGDFVAATRHYPPANQEWFNSVYTYYKNNIKLLPVADNVIINLIRGYFNMYSNFLENKNKARDMRDWKRKLSGRKFWVSKPELKHTNDKVIINLYIYNRQKTFFLRKIRELLSYKLFNYIKKSIKVNSNEFLKDFRKSTVKLLNIINIKDDKFLKNLEKVYLNNLIKRALRKEIFIMHFMQSLFLNRFKFTSLYVEPLKLLLSKVYNNKKIVLNLVKLKTYFLNSDILTQIITTKTRNRKNRILRVLKAAIVNVKTPVLHKKLIIRERTQFIALQNTLLDNSTENLGNNLLKSSFSRVSQEKDILNNIINKNYKSSTRLDVLNSVKNKTVSGIRLEASGRLTKRIIAARAVFKLKYVGTTKNVDSSYKGISSVILRGNTKSNTQLTFLKSKTRIGSFGMKGWLSSI